MWAPFAKAGVEAIPNSIGTATAGSITEFILLLHSFIQMSA